MGKMTLDTKVQWEELSEDAIREAQNNWGAVDWCWDIVGDNLAFQEHTKDLREQRQMVNDIFDDLIAIEWRKFIRDR
jgi:hypothetical protein